MKRRNLGRSRCHDPRLSRSGRRPLTILPTVLRSAVRRTRRVAASVRFGANDVLGRGPVFGPQPLGRHVDASGLRGYYCDFRHKALIASRHPAPFTDRGPVSTPFYPAVIPVAQTALGYWELLLEGHDTQRRFLSLADWLVRDAVPGPAGRGAVWKTPLPIAKYGLESPWASAMGQSEAISVLLRAQDLTGAPHYLELAQAALEPMTIDVADGGLCRRIDGRLVLEEYPTEKPCAVLNGWIFALFGLHELAVAAGDKRAAALLAESTDGLLALLHRYDAGWWSIYSLYPHRRTDLAKPFYQRLHPVLLDALHLIRPDPRLPAMARRWEGQLTTASLTRVIADKLVFRAMWRLEHRLEPMLGAIANTRLQRRS
jgi:heparosan-N-sulfate-glucuronate 5-epimerase